MVGLICDDEYDVTSDDFDEEQQGWVLSSTEELSELRWKVDEFERPISKQNNNRKIPLMPINEGIISNLTNGGNIFS